MKNNSRTFFKKTARVMMILLALCLSFTALPELSAGLLPTAEAEDAVTVDHTFPATATVTTINEFIAGYSSGAVLNLTLGGNVDFTVTDVAVLNEVTTGITIPAGITVNLYMNSKSIIFSRDSAGIWQLLYLRGIVNKGTLNLYAGTMKNPVPTSSKGTIKLVNIRSSMNASSAKESGYSILEGIHNEGTLTVNKNVEIHCETEISYTKNTTSCEASATVGATAINNAAGASCKVNGAILTAKANGQNYTSGDVRCNTRAYAYGIYMGAVEVSGDTQINVESLSYCYTATNGATESRITSVGYGICTDESVKMTGGQISYLGFTGNAGKKLGTASGGYMRVYRGGILTKKDITPELYDGTIFLNTSDSGKTSGFENDYGNIVFVESAVSQVTQLPLSGIEVLQGAINSGNAAQWDGDYPSGTFSVGSYFDEVGNNYTVPFSNTKDSLTTGVTRGGTGGNKRVHIVYRFWKTDEKEEFYTSDKTNGYTFKPTKDGSNIVSTVAVFSGLADAASLMRTADSAVDYSSGGESKNDYFWTREGLYYSWESAAFSDVDFTNTDADLFKSFPASDSDAPIAAVDSVLYIYCDYYRADATGIVLSVDGGTEAEVTYTGSPVLASACNLMIMNSSGDDLTSEYNIDSNDSSKIQVTYTWSGTNAAGKPEISDGSNRLPKNAGEYTVKVSIAEDTTYDPTNCDPTNCDPTLHKNRYGITNYEFELEIKQAQPTQGDLVSAVTLNYGEKLEDKIDLNKTAVGINGETVAGTFTFTEPIKGSSYMDAGTGAVSITWEPYYDADAAYKNYGTAEFSIVYTINKAVLTVIPQSAVLTYGDTATDSTFVSLFDGLTGNETVKEAAAAEAKAQLSAVLSYEIKLGSSYITYSPDDVGVGSYDIRAKISSVDAPSFLKNYTLQFAHETTDYAVNQLTVNKRALTVEASAVSREYDPDNIGATVTFTITGGVYGVDDVSVSNGVGVVSINGAGIRTVSGVDKNFVYNLLLGGKKANYSIGTLTYDTGSSLQVEITKATPRITPPSVADRYYQHSTTLNDIDLSGTSSVEGTWSWATPTLNPTVAVSTYTAVFTPADKDNYKTMEAVVTIRVKPTPVTVTYKGTVEYGDSVPNITLYTYTAEQDPSFSISAVKTTGNLTPSTTYSAGCPVVDGGYAVTITADDYGDTDGNYTFTVVPGTITVTPREIVFTIQDAQVEYGENYSATASTVVMTYDESRLVGSDTINAITVDGSTPVFIYDTGFSYQTNYDVGQYYISATASFTASPNYKTTVQNGTLTVTKANLIVKGKNLTLYYGDELSASTLSSAYTLVGAKRNEKISAIAPDNGVTVSTAYEKGAPVTDAGYDLIVSVNITGGINFKNYNVSVEQGSIMVLKATPTVKNYPTASLIYGQSLADAVFTGGTVNGGIAGSFKYLSASDMPAYSDSTYSIYEAVFIPDDTQNYNYSAQFIAVLTVNKKPVSGVLAINGLPMIGEVLSADVTGLDPDVAGVYTYQWQINGVTVGTGSTYTLQSADETKTVTLIATAGGYYEGTKNAVTTQIAPALQKLTLAVVGQYFNQTGLTGFGETKTVIYDAAAHSVGLTRKTDSMANVIIGNVTVKYNGSTEIPTDAGTYAVTIDVATPDLTHKGDAGYTIYSPAANLRIGTLVISPKALTVNVTIKDKTYDGYNTAEIGAVSYTGICYNGGNADDVALDEDKAVFTFTDASAGENKSVNAGSIELTGAQAGNYTVNLNIKNNGNITIDYRLLRVLAVAEDRTYEKGNRSVNLSFEIIKSSIAPGDNEEDVRIDEAAATGDAESDLAGVRKVTVNNVKLYGDKAANYILLLMNEKTTTVTIQKATPDYPLPEVANVFYDADRRLSDISLGYSQWSWSDDVSYINPPAGEHTYTAVFTPADTQNYRQVEYDVTFTVEKAPITIKAKSYSLTYGESAPTYEYIAEGWTGALEFEDCVNGYVTPVCQYKAGSDVGTYTIRLDGQFSSNNYAFTYENGILTVAKRALTVTATGESRYYEKNNCNVNVIFSALSNVYSADTAKVYLASSTVVGTVDSDAAGTKVVTYTLPELSGSKAGNYTLTVTNAGVTAVIKKAELSGITMPASGTVSYGQKLSTTKFTSDYSGTQYGTFSMENPLTTPKAVGTTSNVYKVVFTPFDTANYATVKEYITLTVTPAEMSLSINVLGNMTVGSTLAVDTASIPEDALKYMKFNWYRVSSPDDDVRTGTLLASDTETYTVTNADRNYYVVCAVANVENSPYSINAKSTSSQAVQEESQSFFKKIFGWFYKLLASFTQLFGGMFG